MASTAIGLQRLTARLWAGAAALLRRIPEHRQLIASLLFYDLIGFTTTDDRNAFLSCLAGEFPLEMLPNSISIKLKLSSPIGPSSV